MAKILEMPKLSPTMEEGVLAAWHKKEGDAVAVDDLLAEVETDKATMEFRAFDKGTLLKILVAAGSTVKLGQAVAVIGNPGEDTDTLVRSGAAPQPQPATSAPKTEEKAPPTTPQPQAVAAPPVKREKRDFDPLRRTEVDGDLISLLLVPRRQDALLHRWRQLRHV